jgi:hypothetical protein
VDYVALADMLRSVYAGIRICEYSKSFAKRHKILDDFYEDMQNFQSTEQAQKWKQFFNEQ